MTPRRRGTVPGRASFSRRRRASRGNVILDAGSLSACADAALARGRMRAARQQRAAGVRSASATHHPIMVAGPQIGYYYPGLTLEMDLEGPGHPASAA